MLSVAFLTFTFALGGTAFAVLGSNRTPAQAGDITRPPFQISEYYHIHTIPGGSLFNPTAHAQPGINPTVATNLINTLNTISGNNLSATRTMEDFSNWATQPQHISQEHGAIYIDLFGQVGDPEAGVVAIPNHGSIESITQFTSRLWRLVYIRDGIATFMMSEPYRNHEFGGIHGGGTLYANSSIRPALLHDFTGSPGGGATTGGVLSHFPSSVRDTLRGSQPWQASQPNVDGAATGNGVPFNNPSVGSDIIWLPSFYEMLRHPVDGFTNWSTVTGTAPNMEMAVLGYGNRHGLWRMNGFDRGMVSVASFFGLPGVSNQSWSRSGRVDINVAAATLVWSGGASAGSSSVSPFGVRPALHVSLLDLVAPTTDAPSAHPVGINAQFEGLAAPTARVSVQGRAGLVPPQVFTADAIRGTWLEFSVTDTNQMIDRLTINGRTIDITPYFRHSPEMRTTMFTHYGAIYLDANRRSVQIRVWDILGNLNITANVATWEPLPPVFQLGAGLAELVSLSHQESLTQSDFRAPQATNFAAFNSALFNAENALFYLEKLTPFEVMVYANDLRSALALRS